MLRKVVGAVVLAAALGAAPAEAQRAVTFGVAGGPTFPQGVVGDELNTGFNVGIFADFTPTFLPFGARFDALFHQLAEPGHGDFQVIAPTLSAKLGLPGGTVVPYLIGGGGLYFSRFHHEAGHAHGGGDDESWSTNLALAGGVGLQFRAAGLNLFAETRFTNVFTEGEATRLLPVTFGISF